MIRNGLFAFTMLLYCIDIAIHNPCVYQYAAIFWLLENIAIGRVVVLICCHAIGIILTTNS